jgi:hypothetical protein
MKTAHFFLFLFSLLSFVPAFAAKSNPTIGVDIFNSFQECEKAILEGRAVSYEPNKVVPAKERLGWTEKQLKDVADGEYEFGACTQNADVTSPYKGKWVPFLPSFKTASKGQDLKMWKCMNEFGTLTPVTKPVQGAMTTQTQPAPQPPTTQSACTGDCQDRVVNIILEKVKARLAQMPPAEVLKIEQKFPVEITPVFDVRYGESRVVSAPPPVFNISATAPSQDCINKCWRGPVSQGDQIVKVIFKNHPTERGQFLSGRYCIPRSLASGIFPERFLAYLNP